MNQNVLPAVKFVSVDIVVEHFAAATVVAELVFGVELVVDVHYRPDYLDAVLMTVAQLVNHLAVAVELKVVCRFD